MSLERKLECSSIDEINDPFTAALALVEMVVSIQISGRLGCGSTWNQLGVQGPLITHTFVTQLSKSHSLPTCILS